MELAKHNKPTKFVKYNGSLRPNCKYCSEHEHKALKIETKNIDTPCKICKKTSIIQKCIACSTCEHFYHGMCLDLNKADIEKYWKLCNIFMCPKCNTSIIPQPNIEARKPKIT